MRDRGGGPKKGAERQMPVSSTQKKGDGWEGSRESGAVGGRFGVHMRQGERADTVWYRDRVWNHEEEADFAAAFPDDVTK